MASDDENGIPAEDEIVEVPIGDSLDLHPFAPRDVRDVTMSYLDAAYEKGFREVRIIHGRGIGVQRQIVRKVLEQDPRVVSFTSASPGAGGWGATVARLC